MLFPLEALLLAYPSAISTFIVGDNTHIFGGRPVAEAQHASATAVVQNKRLKLVSFRE